MLVFGQPTDTVEIQEKEAVLGRGTGQNSFDNSLVLPNRIPSGSRSFGVGGGGIGLRSLLFFFVQLFFG